MSETMNLVGVLTGHEGWVTKVATNSQVETLLVSASRDKTLIVWEITRENDCYGFAKKRLYGHGHFVSDVVISSDGMFALSGSWDKTLRLWDLKAGTTRTRFVGHTKDVLSVAFSADHRHIVSGSRDKTIRLWNTLGECKYTMGGESSDSSEGHSDWVSCVTFNPITPQIISCGWDKMVKVWQLASCKLKTNYIGHTGTVNCVTVSPDGSLCASGGKDSMAMLWDLTDNGKHSYTFEAGQSISALCFSPSRYWLCAAAGPSIVIWDLGSKVEVSRLTVQYDADTEMKQDKLPEVISLCWSIRGDILYAGYTDNKIRVWALSSN